MNKTDAQNKIILVVPGAKQIQIGAVVHLPLALLSLAAWLREKGNFIKNKIKIFDGNLYKIDSDIFKGAAIVGISAMTGRQVKYGLEVAAKIRKINPAAVIVWGGIHASLLSEETVSNPLVDLVVIGEGEQTFLEVVEAVLAKKSLNDIPGTCVQNSNGQIVFGPKRNFINLNELPLPAYDLININDYHGIKYQFDYQSSRGCPYRCGFCYNTVFCNRRYRKKSPDKVVRELIFLKNKYNILNFGFVDDEFFINKKRIESIFDGLLQTGEKFGIIASCRLDVACSFSIGLLNKMKKVGVKQIFFGAESGSDKILKSIRKDITTLDILDGADKIAGIGIRPILSFMSGFPGETNKDLDSTINLIQRLWKKHPLITINGIFPFNAYPGTLLFQKAVADGLKYPAGLKEWGNWEFQYKPDNPWLDSVMKNKMEACFYIIRFRYYLARLEDRYHGNFLLYLLKITTSPLLLSAKLRLKYGWFKMIWEWKLFAFITHKTFGYL